MKVLNPSNAKKGLLLTLKLFGLLFSAFFAFIDIVFGDPDEYEDQETSSSGNFNFKHSDSTAAGKPLTLKNVNNIHNEEW